jgi:predicted transcriptional regulator of viral defense system
MRYHELKALRNKLFFDVRQIAMLLGIQQDSARVLCSRLTKRGMLNRLKKDMYIWQETWEHLRIEDCLKIANIMQVPSYISLMTALTYHGVSTQVQKGYYESCCLKRTRIFDKDACVFAYHKIKKELYYGFSKEEGVFIASKEKALLDAIYLYSLRNYAIDFNSLDLTTFDKKKLNSFAQLFPENARGVLKELWKN